MAAEMEDEDEDSDNDNLVSAYGMVIGHVELLSPEDPFTAGGDSGALVYTVLLDKIDPIGLHKGSKGTISHCLLLEPCFNIIERLLNTDYVFCYTPHGFW